MERTLYDINTEIAQLHYLLRKVKPCDPRGRTIVERIEELEREYKKLRATIPFDPTGL